MECFFKPEPDSLLLNDKAKVMHNLNIIASQNASLFADRITGLIKPLYFDCDINTHSVSIEFPVNTWELNRSDIMHGGITCTMLDHAAGTAVTAYTGCWGPTIDLSVRFLRPIKAESILIGTASIVSAGKTVLHIDAILSDKISGKQLASAVLTYLNIRGEKR